MRFRGAAILCVCLAILQRSAAGQEWEILRPFERGLEGWRLARTCAGELFSSALRDSSEELPRPAGAASLAIPVDFPKEAIVYKESTAGGFRRISYDVYVPSDCPGRVQTLLYLKDKDGLWFQSRCSKRLKPGAWNEFEVDLSGGSIEMSQQDGFGAWSEALASRVAHIGIKIIGDAPYRGTVYLDNLRGVRGAPKEARLAVCDLVPGAARVGRYEPFELTFDMSRRYANPFDPDQIRIDAVFTAPSGKQMRAPAFWWQDYIRSQRGTDEVLTAAGPPRWKVRFAPVELGTYSWCIEATDGAGGQAPEKIETDRQSFECVPSADPGFVRVSPADPRYFEFSDGSPFYPIGHNIRSPNDPRCAQALGMSVPPDRGTYAYDEFFRRMMEEGGENFVEVWMASWWAALEWSPEWKGYGGLTRYNLENAWKLDYVLSAARKRGIYVHLVIDNHGKASECVDPEWADSPYNRINGGFLSVSDEFFTDRRAREIYLKYIRYIMARWAPEAAVAGFEVWSEVDLTGRRHGFGKTESVRAWHREMLPRIKALDPYGHVFTTHYSGSYRNIDHSMVAMPAIDYVSGDGYTGGGLLVDMFREGDNQNVRFKKPYIVTEFGGDWSGATKPKLEADLHSGIWSSYMLGAGGAPLLWWFDYVDRENLYWHFKALSNYAGGEDKRDPGLVTRRLAAGDSKGNLDAQGLVSPLRAYVWVFDRNAMLLMPKPEMRSTRRDAWVDVTGLRKGSYAVEFWDTYKGVVMEDKTLDCALEAARINLPPFTNDVALKLRYQGPDFTKEAKDMRTPRPPGETTSSRESGITPSGPQK